MGIGDDMLIVQTQCQAPYRSGTYYGRDGFDRRREESQL